MKTTNLIYDPYDVMESMPTDEQARFAAAICRQVTYTDDLIDIIGVKKILDHISDEDLINYVEGLGYDVIKWDI